MQVLDIILALSICALRCIVLIVAHCYHIAIIAVSTFKSLCWAGHRHTGDLLRTSGRQLASSCGPQRNIPLLEKKKKSISHSSYTSPSISASTGPSVVLVLIQINPALTLTCIVHLSGSLQPAASPAVGARSPLPAGISHVCQALAPAQPLASGANPATSFSSSLLPKQPRCTGGAPALVTELWSRTRTAESAKNPKLF